VFRIKICGVTTASDAAAVAAAGADAVGLNFCPTSPRAIDLATAREIVAALPPGVTKVGVFVDTPLEEVQTTAEALGLDLLQLHGDEPPECLAALAPRRVMKAFRLGAEGLPAVLAYLAACRRLDALPEAVLLDAYVPGQHGGSGKTADWPAAAEYAARNDAPPLVLAGGLTPENVAAAIQAVRPAAVDTASGVESSPGVKDAVRVAAFIEATRAALEETRKP